MRKLLGTLVVIALIVGGIGYVRGWFSLATDNRKDETNLELKINKQRIKQDTQEAAEKVKQLGNSTDK